KEHPDLSIIFVTNSRAFSVARYLDEYKNKNVHLIGYDFLKQNVEYFNKGIINFLICHIPEEQGYKGIMSLYHHLALSLPVERIYFMPIDIITKENQEFYRQREDIPLLIMPNINTNSHSQNTFDAIVVGSGISGGWAAKELCDHGLKTQVLERGKDVQHIKDYPTATQHPWDFPHRGQMPLAVRKENPVVSRCYAFGEASEHFFVKDKEHPYQQEKPFDWIRGYQVGGKSLLWARQV